MNVHSIVKSGFEIGMMQIETEVMQLAAFLAAFRPHHVMEIGTDQGGLFYVLTQLATGKKVSLDLPGGPWGSVPFHKLGERDRMIRSWDEDVVLMRADSHSEQIAASLSLHLDSPLDFLFIDGDHSLEGVTEDFHRYSPFVRAGGWIGFHDINDTLAHRDSGVYVAPLWDQLRGEKYEFNAGESWGGIGLIRSPAILEPTQGSAHTSRLRKS